MTYSWYEDEPRKIPFAFKNNAGGDAKVQDGSIVVTDGGEGVIALSIDGNFIVAKNLKAGKWTGKITADADLGEGDVQVAASFEGEILSRMADHVELGDAVPA